MHGSGITFTLFLLFKMIDVPLELNFIVEELPHVSINSPDTINLLNKTATLLLQTNDERILQCEF